MGTRVSLTLLAFAHFSIMSREASWIGFFMYPTLSSRSWARLGLPAASMAPAATAIATTPFSNLRPGEGNRPCIVAFLLMAPGRRPNPLCYWGAFPAHDVSRFPAGHKAGSGSRPRRPARHPEAQRPTSEARHLTIAPRAWLRSNALNGAQDPLHRFHARYRPALATRARAAGCGDHGQYGTGERGRHPEAAC